MRCVPVAAAAGSDPVVGACGGEALPVEVVRSARRTKTAEARLVDGRLVVRIPARSTRAEEHEFVTYFLGRFQRNRTVSSLDLVKRAATLARRYRLPEPVSIRWVGNQRNQWGSCTPVDGSIRLSDRMAGFPSWVIDYVIVHELAHLVVADHGPRFQALVDAYPRAERARGYLMAREELGR